MARGNVLRKANKLKYVNLHSSENVLSRQHGHLRMGTGKEKGSSCHVGEKEKATQGDSSLSHSPITISYLKEGSNYWFDNCNITQLQSQTRLEAKQNRFFHPLLILQRKKLMCAYSPNPPKCFVPSSPRKNIFQGSNHSREEAAPLLVLPAANRKLEQTCNYFFNNPCS